MPGVVLRITKKCNQRCDFCFFLKDLQKSDFDINFDELVATIPVDADVAYVTGGEPSLSPNFERVIDYLTARNFRRITLQTNGTAYLFREKAEVFRKIHQFYISVPSLVPEVFRAVTGNQDPQALNTLRDNIAFLREIDKGIIANTVLSYSVSYPTLMETIDQLLTMPIDSCDFSMLIPQPPVQKKLVNLVTIPFEEIIGKAQAAGKPIQFVGFPKCLLPQDAPYWKFEQKYPYTSVEKKSDAQVATRPVSRFCIQTAMELPLLCENCSEYSKTCIGISSEYITRFGFAPFEDRANELAKGKLFP